MHVVDKLYRGGTLIAQVLQYGSRCYLLNGEGGTPLEVPCPGTSWSQTPVTMLTSPEVDRQCEEARHLVQWCDSGSLPLAPVEKDKK